MKVALFVPCYINALYPEVAAASLKVLRHLGVDVEVPAGQTCCGQPMANAGFEKDATGMASRYEKLFAGYDYVVGPAASCVVFVRDRYDTILGHKCEAASRTMDICEFIHDVLSPVSLPSRFPHKVSMHNSCHGVRLMGLSTPSELQQPYQSKLRDLLSLVEGIEVLEPERKDECCGFGGLFSLEESAVSVKMGSDKVRRHIATGAEYITGADCSCLMHMGGIIREQGLPIKTVHMIEILASGL